MSSSASGCPASTEGEGDEPLGERLRRATNDWHRAVERTALVQRLLDGALPRGAYRALLVNLRAVYASLEDGLDAHRDAIGELGPLLGRLARVRALDDDLAVLASDAADPVPSIVEPTRAYASHLVGLAQARPLLLVAHAYVRYLGDLSGGRILARVVASRMGGPTAFYDFGDAREADTLKQAFRSALDALPASDDERRGIEAEAADGFRRHAAMFEALEKVGGRDPSLRSG